MTVDVTVYRDLVRLYASLKRRRKVQLNIIALLMLAASVAEVVNLGALFPLIALFMSPQSAAQKPIVRDLFRIFGPEAEIDPAWIATLLFAMATVIAAAIRFILLYCSGKVNYMIAHEFAVEVFRRTIYQTYQTHISRNSSVMLSSMPKVDEVAAALNSIVNTISALLMATFVLTAMIFVNPTIAGGTILIFAIMYSLVGRFTRPKMARNAEKINQEYTSRLKTFQEALGGIRDILIDQTQPLFVAKFSTSDLALRKAHAENVIFAPSTRLISEPLGMILIGFLGYYMTKAHGSIEAFTTLTAIAFGAQRILPMVQQIYHGYTIVHYSHRNVSDVLHLLNQPIELNAAKPCQVDFEREIRLNKVCFKYEKDMPLILDDADLSIARGSRIGFVGTTGSGKSTLVDLILGLLQPTEGAIWVDDISISNPEARLGWQRKIAHVPQAIYLVDGSIVDNIAYGVAADHIDMSLVKKVARDAQLTDFIERLPAGYFTRVGERGVRLSGGQRQRIGIARALYKKPAILILDEATSALDSVTEASVMETIYALRRNLTLLMIAHRTSTLIGCDIIYRLEGGKVLTVSASESADLNESADAIRLSRSKITESDVAVPKS
jgi:ATP-binding cassette, subfamily B, bacterial PglK